MSGSPDPIPRGVVRRITIAVILVFLVTMAVFLRLAFMSERNLHHRATFEHLEETLAVLSILPELRGEPMGDGLSMLEGRLAQRTRIPHRILLADAALSIVGSAESELVGNDIRSTYGLEPHDAPDASWAIGSTDDGSWMAVARPHGETGDVLYLLRLRRGGDGFAVQFWRVHGPHVVATVLLFALVLHSLGKVLIRRPLEQLGRHVQRLEAGEFWSQPEVYRNDEFGWLAKRFTQMGRRLRETVEKLVLSEKAAAAGATAYRVARQAVEPLARMKRHVAYLEGLAGKDPDLRRVVASLEKDRWAIAGAVILLEELDLGAAADSEETDEQGTG